MPAKIEIRILSEQQLSSVAPTMPEMIAIVEDTYRMAGRGEAEVPTKFGVHPERPGSFCHAMPAWISPAGALGMKWISYYPGNLARDLPDSTGIIILNDPETGLPVAVMEGMWITYARTAACAAIAAKYLANPEPRRLGLIGCGGLGRWSLRTLSELFPSIREVRVNSRTAASREAFCAEMRSDERLTLIPVAQAEDAIRGMDIVVTSIPKTGEHPAQEAFWTAGTLAIPLDVTGAWDDDAFARADMLVTDGWDAFARAAARRPDIKLPAHPVDLADVLLGRVPGRTSASQRIMAVPTGVASVDMTLAWEIFRRARAAGLGTVLALT